MNKTACSPKDVAFDCSSCRLRKSKSLPFPSHKDITTNCFDLIHTNVWGIAPAISHSYHKYFLTVIDDNSRFTWIYFIHAKSEVFNVFKKFLSLVENQFSKTIRILHFDSGEGGGNMSLNHSKIFYSIKASFLKERVHTLLSKME